MSEMGRESGLESLKDYTQVKSVWIVLSGQTRDPFKPSRPASPSYASGFSRQTDGGVIPGSGG